MLLNHVALRMNQLRPSHKDHELTYTLPTPKPFNLGFFLHGFMCTWRTCPQIIFSFTYSFNNGCLGVMLELWVLHHVFSFPNHHQIHFPLWRFRVYGVGLSLDCFEFSWRSYRSWLHLVIVSSHLLVQNLGEVVILFCCIGDELYGEQHCHLYHFLLGDVQRAEWGSFHCAHDRLLQ